MSDKNPLPPHLRLCITKKPKIANTQELLKIAAPKSTQFLYNLLRVGPRVVLRSAFELLRANTITRILSAAVLLSIDTVSLAKGRISKKQYLINISLAFMLLFGGTAGWILGTAVVGLVLIENAAIGILAALIGAGTVGGAVAYLWERFIALFFKGDAEEMVDLLNQEFYREVSARCLKEEEILEVKNCIEFTAEATKEMFVSEDKNAYARNIICHAIEKTKFACNISPKM